MHHSIERKTCYKVNNECGSKIVDCYRFWLRHNLSRIVHECCSKVDSYFCKTCFFGLNIYYFKFITMEFEMPSEGRGRLVTDIALPKMKNISSNISKQIAELELPLNMQVLFHVSLDMVCEMIIAMMNEGDRIYIIYRSIVWKQQYLQSRVIRYRACCIKREQKYNPIPSMFPNAVMKYDETRSLAVIRLVLQNRTGRTCKNLVTETYRIILWYVDHGRISAIANATRSRGSTFLSVFVGYCRVTQY